MKLKFFTIVLLLSHYLSEAPAQNSWTQKTSPGSFGRISAIAFSIGSKGYIGTGRDPSFTFLKDFWEWDQVTNTWTQKADFGGGLRCASTAFSIGSKGYVATGVAPSGNYVQDFWEWDQTTNIWTQKSSFSGMARNIPCGFSIGTKGYMGTGYSTNGLMNDFWEWDQSTNIWTQRASFMGSARLDVVAFSLNGYGYAGLGWDGALQRDFYQYDPTTNKWTKKADFPGAAREWPVGFPIGCYAYVGVGFGHDAAPYYNDFYRYDPVNDSWTQKANYGGSGSAQSVGFVIGNKGYIGTGSTGSGFFNDFWEYDPGIIPFSVNATSTSICFGQSVTLTATGGNNYSWNTGETTSSIVVSPLWTSPYSVNATGTCGTATASVSITVSSVTIDPGPTQTICYGDTTSLSAGTYASSFTWSPANSLSNSSISNPGAFPSATTTYTVRAANAQGCTAADTQKIYVMPVPPTPTVTANGNVLTSSAPAGNQWYLNGSILPGATSQTCTAIQSGMYHVVVTDTNGCGAISPPYNLVYNGIAITQGGTSNILFTQSNGYVQIEITSRTPGKISLVVLNSLGQTISDREILPNGILVEKIDIRTLPNGIYFFQVVRDGKISTHKCYIEN